MKGISKIAIDIERPDGVYYAGEVVRGTVQLKTSSPVKCRGFHVTFQGKAHVHWHTGSGKNRHDFDGTTYFVCQRHTLLGNFYRTGLLDEAGETAIFGKVHGDGIMYIPCKKSEEESLNLVVRVMDYDFGKKDDLLGELVVDVAELARSKTMIKYDLTRFGKPEKGEVHLSAKFVPRDALFQQTSTSNNKTPLILILTVHQAMGLRKADWAGKNDVYVQAYRFSDDSQRRSRNQLPEPDKKYTIPAGKSTFDFAFAIPTDAPGSAEIPLADSAWIRYKIYAHVDLAFWRDPCMKRMISVIPNRPVPKPLLLSPVTRQLNDFPLYDCSFCLFNCCKLDGLVSFKLTPERQSYAPGETIKLLHDSVVSNESSSTLDIEIELQRHVYMFTHYSRTSGRQTYSLLDTTCNANSTYSLGQHELQVPSVFPSFDGGVKEATRTRYSCLKWEYTLLLKVSSNGRGTQATVAIPILIACAPPYQNSVKMEGPAREAPPTWTPLSIFRDAISDQQHSSTTPTITGPEDGGTPQPANKVGLINFYSQEDAGQVANDYPFVPVVNCYNSNSQEEVVLAQAEVLSDIQLKVTELLQKMDESYDKRRAVGDWIKQNPQMARQLQPSDVGQILSKVSFSLEQPGVAAEVAGGLQQSNVLTCNHVVEAIRMCNYQKSDVAKAMVGYVCDPENRHLILDEIEFSYERDDVAKLFR